MKEISFNGIKNKIHLKPCVLDIKRKDKEYKKQYEHKKLTFYKDYKSKMLWFNNYGIGLDNLNFKEIIENKVYLIETDKTIINIELKEEAEQWK